MIRITFATAIAALACLAQESEGRLRFAYIGDDQAMTEAVTMMRSIADVKHLTVDWEAREVVFRADAESRKLAEWIHAQLDRPASEHRARTAEFMVNDGKAEGAVRIFFSGQPETPRSLQELATVLRATVEIRRLFASSVLGAIAIRGTVKQAEAAQWLLGRLRPDSGAAMSPPEFNLDRREGVVRVAKIRGTAGPVETRELETVVRSTVGLRWVFSMRDRNAVVIRGLPEQLAAAEWLIARMEEAPDARSRRHVFTLAKDDFNRVYPELEMRVYVLPMGNAPARIQQLATKLRIEAQLRRVFVHNGARLIAVRGTADQIAASDRLFFALADP